MKSNILLWTALLLFVPVSVPASAADCPIDCPGDLNGDCKVDHEDLAILSQYWLKDCVVPPKLPLLKINSAGINEDQAAKLAEALGIPEDQLILHDGVATFVDPVNLQHVPTVPVEDQNLIDRLRRASQDNEGELFFEALDLPALRAIRPVPTAEALQVVRQALRQADIDLGQAVPEASHTTFELVDLKGELLLPAVQVDTQVNIQTYFNGIPVLGPGAQFSASFDPQGNPTHLNLATRSFEPADEVELTVPGEGGVRPLASAVGSPPDRTAKLVYWAPPLSNSNVQYILPHFALFDKRYGAEGQVAEKLVQIIPAVSGPQLVPQILLDVTAEGSQIQADAAVTGGTPPYSYEWISSSADLSDIPADESAIEYTALPQRSDEMLTVRVTDGNGIVAQASQTIAIQVLAAFSLDNLVGPLAGGVRDFGVERAVSDLGAANQSGFVNRFLAEGVFKRFNWSGPSAWEQDFKQPPAGTDTDYVDNVDIVFYIGHGYGGGFTFESEVDDEYLTYSNAAGAWGNFDAEWISLLSCEVLKDTWDGKKWWTRWGPAFDGLHLLTGFQTVAYDWSNFGRRYAQYVLGRDFVFTKVTLPIRAAWFQAKKEEQPSSVEAVVMGVVGPGGVLSGYNDYFWGKGPVSPDLRGNNITAYWRLVYK